MPPLSFQGGSIAKGTALKNDADLDCVMVMNSITNASQLRSKLPDILRTLESRLGSSIGDSWRLTSIKKTRFSLQFNMTRYSNPGESVKVDLLPTFEASVEGNSGTYLTKGASKLFLLILAIRF